MPESDALAIARARNGDSDAFQALVERHGRGIFRVAHRLTGNTQDAEDVVQETFLRAYRQLGRFEARSNFSTWLHRIAVNCSIDLIRSRPRRESAYDEEDLDAMVPDAPSAASAPSPERLALSAQVQDRVTAALGWLSPRERAAFVLRHVEGRSIDEISGLLGLRSNATKHSIFRAVRKMRAALEPFLES